MTKSPRRKEVLFLELAKLLEAGFGIRQAIAVILETKPPAAEAAALRKMDDALAAGRSIADAFTESGAEALEQSLVRAGERGGKLAQAFRHLADYFGLVADARRDVWRAMVYPLLMLHLGVIIAVVPGGLMAEKGAGEVLFSAILAVVALEIVLLLLGIAVKAVLGLAPKNAAADRLLNWLPVIGKARKALAMARFTKVYHTGLLAGLSMEETVGSSLDASHSGMLRSGGRRLLAKAKEGGALGPEFIASGVFPVVFSRSYATAEEAGGLDKDLERWAKRYQDEAARGIQTIAAVLPKVLYFLILLFVAWTIIDFYMERLEILDRIGEDTE
jgi:type II secretory pathway component PulF